jgi:hypothetical protein
MPPAISEFAIAIRIDAPAIPTSQIGEPSSANSPQ